MKKPKKKGVLFIGQLPPPWHGVSAINRWIIESIQLNKDYDFYPINLTTATSIANIGQLSIRKYIHFFKTAILTFYKMLRLSPTISYITLTPTGSAFIKDSLILLILKTFGKPIIVHFHGKGITNWLKSKPNWIKSYYRKVMKGTHLIVLGNKLINDVETVYEQKPFVVPNGIPLFNFNSSDSLDHPKFEILFLSNLMKSKGILDFVEALAILNKRVNNFNAFIIGDSGDLSIEYIKQRLIKNNLQHCVEALGPKYNEEKCEYLSSADVLVFPTQNEAFGLVILEAMQVGLPIITTNEGCIPDIIEDGENGFILEKKNPQSISDTLEKLINNPKLKIEIGARNKAKFHSQFTLDIFEKNLLNVFNEVTG